MKYTKVQFKLELYYTVYIAHETDEQLTQCINSLNIDDVMIDGYEHDINAHLDIEKIETLSEKPKYLILDASEYSGESSE